jgi:putative DNA methylase
VTYRPKLIEVALPLDAINEESARRKRKAPGGYPTTIHTWWAQRPVAACRAVLFAQLVDDPSGWPEEFPTEAAQDRERDRLFGILRSLIDWDNTANLAVIYEARLAIARSFARQDRHAAMAEGVLPDNVIEMQDRPPIEDINRYLATRVSPVHDPFAGGGTIPLAAQWLGLRAVGADLNPVPVLINLSLTVVPNSVRAARPPVPLVRHALAPHGLGALEGAVRHYGALAAARAQETLRSVYPPYDVVDSGKLPPELRGQVGRGVPVVAWIWARTVASPNPAAGGAHVPLVSTWSLSTKSGREAWVDCIVDRQANTYRFEVRYGGEPARRETVERAGGRCILTDAPIPFAYIRAEAAAGRLGRRLMAVVLDGGRGRIHASPTQLHEEAAFGVAPPDAPYLSVEIDHWPGRTNVVEYGMTKWVDLFAPRQVLGLSTLADEIDGLRPMIEADAGDSGVEPAAFANAVALYLGFALSRAADYGSTLATWRPKDNAMRSSIPKALAMSWDYAEANPFGRSSGGFLQCVDVVAGCLARLPAALPYAPAPAEVHGPVPVQEFAASRHSAVWSTDPPYYHNVAYSNLSDFYYVWLRRSLQRAYPAITRLLQSPKREELVANPYRFAGDMSRAQSAFQNGLEGFFRDAAASQPSDVPMTVYYAFKQAESTEDEAVSSTGWESMLAGLVSEGLVVQATWPIRTEGDNRQMSVGMNALASSIVLVCRRRDPAASSLTRSQFLRALRSELPSALRHLQHGNIAPVDVAQAAIGPGMGIFSRHAKVLEADGKPMTVRTALQLINEALDEFLSESEGELDSDSRFAVSWFETYGYETGPFGVAENIAKGRNVSVSGVAEAGILTAAAGKVRLHRRAELPGDWNPATDKHLTVWEATQHLIKRHEEVSEESAAELLKALGPVADQARALAYRLYSACERRKWAEEARAYNGLVVAWPELERLAAQVSVAPAKPATKQGKLF